MAFIGRHAKSLYFIAHAPMPAECNARPTAAIARAVCNSESSFCPASVSAICNQWPGGCNDPPGSFQNKAAFDSAALSGKKPAMVQAIAILRGKPTAEPSHSVSRTCRAYCCDVSPAVIAASATGIFATSADNFFLEMPIGTTLPQVGVIAGRLLGGT